MIEADLWVVIVLDILLFGVLPVLFGIFVKCWWNVMRTKGMMVAEIMEPNGDLPRTLVKTDPTGQTVTVDNIVYRLPREFSDDEIKKFKEKGIRIYPRKIWMYMHNFPLPSIPLRIELWERNNPEPIRPFYGRILEDGKFDDSQLTVTGTEWHIQQSAMKAAELGTFYQEMAAAKQELTRLMSNIPNKIIVYIGIGIAATGSIYCAVTIYQMAMGG